MQKAIEIAKKIKQDLTANYSEMLEEYGLHDIFSPVYSSQNSNANKNKIVCYIIHAYNPESNWLDLRKDRMDNKVSILSFLDADPKSELFKRILENKDSNTNESVFMFLEELKDWRWRSVFDLLEYAARMSRFASMETEDEKKYEKVDKTGNKHTVTEEVAIETIVKVNNQKGDLITKSLDARRKAMQLIEEISKEFVATEDAVQKDFDFSFTETTKSKDILSWRKYIKRLQAKGITIR
jgi:hypothetical protein